MRSGSKRVKTGCLTCRRRRRKCDEAKPQCENCLNKGLTCQYRTSVTFIASNFQSKVANPDSQQAKTIKEARLPNLTQSSLPNALTRSIASNDSVQLTEVDEDCRSERLVVEEPAGTLAPSSTAPKLHDTWHTGSLLAHDQSKRNLGRKLYELELLSYFRYHVAQVLDLGLGNPWFGVTALIDSRKSESTYNAILATAASQRGSVSDTHRDRDLATGIASSLFPMDVGYQKPVQRNFIEPLCLWRQVCLTSIDQWCTISTDVSSVTEPCTSLSEWLVMARICCAARLSTPSFASSLPVLSEPPSVPADTSNSASLFQLADSLGLLAQILVDICPRANVFTTWPSTMAASEWHARWQKLQRWYSLRTDQMRQVFELPIDDETLSRLNATQEEFPHIVFTSHCAVVANAAHHMSSFLLLHKKPRLLKIGADITSSTSSLWHLSRTIGIVAKAARAGLWDVLTTAILVCCSRSLSNVKQIQSVTSLLRHIHSISGLQLSKAISDLDRTATSATDVPENLREAQVFQM